MYGNNVDYSGMVKLLTGNHRVIEYSKDPSRNTSDTTIFRFYKQPNDSNFVRVLSFYFDWSTIPRHEKIAQPDYRGWLSPMTFFDDTTSGHFRIYFTCKSIKDGWFEIVVNETTRESLWIKDNKQIQFYKWQKLIRKNSVTIATNSTVYSKRDTSSEILSENGGDCFEVNKIIGNWMRVNSRKSELCNYDDKLPQDQMWIRFRTSGGIAVKLEVR